MKCLRGLGLSAGILLSSLVFTGAEPSGPATYYVNGPGGDGLADGGSDSNRGTIDAPWLTLVHATQQLKPGDTLYIRGGTYAEYPRDTIPSGTPEARVTVTNTDLVVSNNLTRDDRMFVALEKGDFRLKQGSPAIDAGIVLKVGLGPAAKEITNDVEGTPRPQGSAPDVGAYEFKVSQPK